MKKIKMNKTIRNIKTFEGDIMISYRYGRNKNTLAVEILKVDYDLYKEYKLEDYKMQLEMMDSCEFTDQERDETLNRILKFKTFSLMIDEIRFDLQYWLNKDLEFEFKDRYYLYFNIIGDINWEEF